MQSNLKKMYKFNRNLVWYSRHLGFKCVKQFKSHPKCKDFVKLYWDFTMNDCGYDLSIPIRNMEIELRQR